MKKAFFKLAITLIIILLIPVHVFAEEIEEEDFEYSNEEITEEITEEIEHSVYASIVDNGNTVFTNTTAATVGEFLAEHRVRVHPRDLISHCMDEPLTNGTRIIIERGYEITFQIRYVTPWDIFTRFETIYVSPGQRIRQVVQWYMDETGEDYAYDETIARQEVTPDMVIVLHEAETVRISTNEEVPYETEYVYAGNLPEGYRLTITEGESGTRFVIKEIRYEIGVEVFHTRIHEEITFFPVNEVIAIGTGPADLPAPDHHQTGGSGDNNAQTEFAGNFNYVNHTDNGSERYESLYQNVVSAPIIMPDDETYVAAVPLGNFSVAQITLPESASAFLSDDSFFYVDGMAHEFSRQFNMSATAYTADFASTGKRPGDRYFGITASGLKAQVGVVAVDPNVIPLFTKLYIEGYGFAIAGDTGGGVRGEVIDLYFNTSSEVRQFGRQRRNVYILADQDFEIAIIR